MKCQICANELIEFKKDFGVYVCNKDEVYFDKNGKPLEYLYQLSMKSLETDFLDSVKTLNDFASSMITASIGCCSIYTALFAYIVANGKSITEFYNNNPILLFAALIPNALFVLSFFLFILAYNPHIYKIKDSQKENKTKLEELNYRFFSKKRSIIILYKQSRTNMGLVFLILGFALAFVFIFSSL